MPYKITYDITDNDGDEADTSVWVPEGGTIPHYEEFAWRWASHIDPLIFGIFRQLAKLTIPIDISALAGNIASADSDVEQVAAFEFVTAQGSQVKFNIPALNELDILNFTDEMDTADPNIAAVIAMFEDGLLIGATQVQPTNIAEEDIVGTLYARAKTRNSGRRRK